MEPAQGFKGSATGLIYSLVASFKKQENAEKETHEQKKTIPFTKLEFNRGLIHPEIEEEIKKIKEKTMTYIISGKFKNNPFLMIDCVGTRKEENGDKTFIFRNKLKKLISTENETYFCFTGSELYQNAIEAFDEKCYWENVNFDFKNTKHIEEILNLFKLICKTPNYKGFNIGSFCRLYFVDKYCVYYYNIDDDGKLSYLHETPNNTFIKPSLSTNDPIEIDLNFENNEEIIEFCKNEITKLHGYSGLDLKDKFSYVVFDEIGKTTNNSMKTNDEIVLSMVAGDYNEIKL